jgi:hypothetical protein
MLDRPKLDAPDTSLPWQKNVQGLREARLYPLRFDFREHWVPSLVRGDPDQPLTFTIANDSDVVHNLSVEVQGIDIDIPPATTLPVRVQLPSAGSLLFFCKYHEDAGMVGELLAGSAPPTLSHRIYVGPYPGY